MVFINRNLNAGSNLKLFLQIPPCRESSSASENHFSQTVDLTDSD